MRRTVITNVPTEITYIDRTPEGTYVFNQKIDKYNDDSKYLTERKYLEMPESFENGMNTITTNNGLVLIYKGNYGIIYDLFPEKYSLTSLTYDITKYNANYYVDDINTNHINLYDSTNYDKYKNRWAHRIFIKSYNSNLNEYVILSVLKNGDATVIPEGTEYVIVIGDNFINAHPEKEPDITKITVNQIIKLSVNNVNFSTAISEESPCRANHIYYRDSEETENQDIILKNTQNTTPHYQIKNKQSYHSVVCKSDSGYLKPQCNIIASDFHGTIDMDLPSNYNCTSEDIYCKHGLYKFTKSELDSFYIKAKPYLYISTGTPELEEMSKLSFIQCSDNIYYIANITDESYVEFKVKGSSDCIVEFM